MGARADMLAKQFEEKANELTDAVQKMSDADWKKITTAEKWPVGVTAHHVAGAHEPIVGIAKAVAAGQTLPPFTMQMLDDANAKHAKDFAGCTKAETLDLHRRGAAAAAAVLRGIPDEGFARSSNVLVGMPPMSAEQLATGLLCSHPNDHLASIKATVGA